MTSTIVVALTFVLTNVLAYHDPDLNYHLSQAQKLQNCDHGYSYPVPPLQLTTAGVKYAPNAISHQPQHLQAGHEYHSGYSAGVYQANAYDVPIPKITYAQPASTYQSVISHGNYAAPALQKEVHGYSTSAGLSSASSSGRTVTPLATYAQAPIIAKITAAPLFARFAQAPAKTTYVTQNLVAQQALAAGSLAKASLNSYSIQNGGPVVTQVYAAPAARYAASPALRAPSQLQTVPRFTAIANPAISQYSHVQPISGFTPIAPLAQYSSFSHVPGPQTSFLPAVQQFSGPVAQYSGLSSGHYQGGLAGSQYSGGISAGQYSGHYTGGSSAQRQYAAPAVTHVSAGHREVIAKNVHTEFVENYDAHPRYAYEYAVHDPQTGDIKQQKEQRDGEVVKGQYSLVEPDGSVRTVDYVADWETGFHANVRNSRDQH